MTRTLAGVLHSGKLELLDEPKGLREGRVQVTINDELEHTSEEWKLDRRAFMRLPLAERRRIMEEQAEAAAPRYEQDAEWREWLAGDIVEY